MGLIRRLQLLGQETLPTIIPQNVKEDFGISTIPVIEWDRLKDWPEPENKSHQEKKILIDMKIAKESFALVMPDSSMEPLFQKNALLIFDSAKIPKDRDFVIVHLKHDNIIIFNRFFTENNLNYIRQNTVDDNINLIKLGGINDRILGTLIEVRVQY